MDLPANHRPVEALHGSDSAASLLARARTLRTQARKVNPVLADAYIRRAAYFTWQGLKGVVRLCY